MISRDSLETIGSLLSGFYAALLTCALSLSLLFAAVAWLTSFLFYPNPIEPDWLPDLMIWWSVLATAGHIWLLTKAIPQLRRPSSRTQLLLTCALLLLWLSNPLNWIEIGIDRN